MANEQKPWKQYTKSRWPAWLKALVLKWWSAGAVMFFVGWGITISIADALDTAILLGIAAGVFTDLIINSIIELFEHEKGECEWLIMWRRNKLSSLFLNIVHSVLVCLLVAYSYQFANVIAISTQGLDPTKIVFPVEPIFFGILYLGYDLLIITIKQKVFNKHK